jgi:hypothetical protein
MLRITQCLDNRLTDGGKVVSPTHRPSFTPHKHYFSASGTHFRSRLSKPQGLVRPEGLGKLRKNHSYLRVSNPRPFGLQHSGCLNHYATECLNLPMTWYNLLWMAFQPILEAWLLFSSLMLCTVDRTPWTEYQSDARPRLVSMPRVGFELSKDIFEILFIRQVAI